MEEGLIADGTIAQDTGQAQGIWGLREGISVALRHAGQASTRCPEGFSLSALIGLCWRTCMYALLDSGIGREAAFVWAL